MNQFDGLSHSLNIDCTILLAMVSDLSHVPVEDQLWFSDYTKSQIEEEKTEPVLVTYHYPVMANHPLVTTREAYNQFNIIVGEIGTDTEKQRASLLVEDESNSSENLSREDVIREWSQFSTYPVPPDLQFPIRVVDKDEIPEDEDSKNAPPFPSRLAQVVGDNLTDINKSVFIYGWRAGRTTISSNVITTNKIRHLIEANRREDENDAVGPQVWHRAPSRSLLSKEKTKKASREAGRKNNGVQTGRGDV